MAGAYVLTLSRAHVAERVAGQPTGRTWGPCTLAIRDGVAVLRRPSTDAVLAEMPAGTYVRNSSASYTVVGTDGTTEWAVRRRGG